MSFDPTTVEWYKVMERKNLFFVGLSFCEAEVRLFGQITRFDLKYFLFKNEGEMWSTYRSKSEYNDLYFCFKREMNERPIVFQNFANMGLQYGERARERIASGPTNFADDYELFSKMLVYGVTIPWAVIGTFESMNEKDRTKNKHILDSFEKFRAESLYPEYEKKILSHYWDQIHQATGISLELISFMTPWELKKYFESKTVPVVEELERRRAYCVHWYDPETNSIVFSYDKSIENQIPILMQEAILETKELKGTIAFKGKVSGKVRIVYEPVDCADFIEGEILVSPSTNPSLMAAITKCAGIVTDEGGMTSHAAIIARELKKPAVIGTKIATKILKNGQMVEVDAEKGIVRIL